MRLSGPPQAKDNLTIQQLKILKFLAAALIDLRNHSTSGWWSDELAQRTCDVAGLAEKAIFTIVQHESAVELIAVMKRILAEVVPVPRGWGPQEPYGRLLNLLEWIEDDSLLPLCLLEYSPGTGSGELTSRQRAWLAVLLIAFRDVEMKVRARDLEGLRHLGDAFHNVPVTIWMEPSSWEDIWIEEAHRYQNLRMFLRPPGVRLKDLLEIPEYERVCDEVLGIST